MADTVVPPEELELPPLDELELLDAAPLLDEELEAPPDELELELLPAPDDDELLDDELEEEDEEDDEDDEDDDVLPELLEELEAPDEELDAAPLLDEVPTAGVPCESLPPHAARTTASSETPIRRARVADVRNLLGFVDIRIAP